MLLVSVPWLRDLSCVVLLDESRDRRARFSEYVSGFPAALRGRDNLDVRNAYEAQRLAQVGRCKIGVAIDRYAARRDDDIRFLAVYESDRTVIGVAKRESRSRDHVDPGLQCGRHTEVVDRRADDDDIRRLQLLDERV